MLWKFEVLEGNNFVIVSKKDNSVLDLFDGKDFKGNKLITHERNNNSTQIFNIQNLPKGQILIRNQISGKCLDNYKKGKDSQFFRIWDCDMNSKNQLIRLTYARPCKYLIFNIIKNH
jgi:hypothetical protein